MRILKDIFLVEFVKEVRCTPVIYSRALKEHLCTLRELPLLPPFTRSIGKMREIGVRYTRRTSAVFPFIAPVQ